MRSFPSATALTVFILPTCFISKASGYVPTPLIETAVGFVSGSAGALAAYPIDFVKSQLQTQEGRQKYQDANGFDAAMDIVQNSPMGPLALYRGVGVQVMGVAPEKTIKLSTNNWLRVALKAHFGSLPLLGEIVAGGCAGMAQVLITNPLEVVKIQIQTSSTSQRSLQDILKEIKHPGDLYQGAGACVARDVVFSSILFPLYAHGKILLASILVGQGVPEATFWANLLAGSLAAAPAAILSTPADVVKTRIQQFSSDEDAQQSSSQQEGNLFQVGQHLIETEGAAVLFSGWLERVVRSVPQFGVTLATFDTLTMMATEHGWITQTAAGS